MSDVHLDADPAFFTFDGEAFFPGPFGDGQLGGSTGRQFRGEPTARGRREGVHFSVRWTDEHGDEQPKTGGEGLPATVELAPEPFKPLVQPTWQIGKPKQNAGRDIYVLVNGAEGSVTNNIVVDANPNYFTFLLKKELGDIVGIGLQRLRGPPDRSRIRDGI